MPKTEKSIIKGVDQVLSSYKDNSLWVTGDPEHRTEILKEFWQETKDNSKYLVIYVDLNKYSDYIDEIGLNVLKKALISESLKKLPPEKQKIIGDDIAEDKFDVIIKRIFYQIMNELGKRPVVILDNFDRFATTFADSSQSDEDKENFLLFVGTFLLNLYKSSTGPRMIFAINYEDEDKPAYPTARFFDSLKKVEL